MQSKMLLRLKQDNSHLIVQYNGTPFIRVTKSVLIDFLSDSSSSKDTEIEVEKVTKKKRKKKIKKKDVIDAKKIKKANQLSKKYTVMKKKFFKSRVMKKISPNTKDFEHIIKAVDIINRHEVTIKTFLKAQVSGLSFIGAKGIFPKVPQLSTDAAETRLLEYLKEKNMEVELTDKEMQTELQRNRKYMKFHEKIEEETATLFEATYVKECQLARRDEVQTMVEKYIKKMKRVV